jgi:hypothetical protein
MKRYTIEWTKISKNECRGIAILDEWEGLIFDSATKTKKFEVILKSNHGATTISSKPIHTKSIFGPERVLPEMSEKDYEKLIGMAKGYFWGVRNEVGIYAWDTEEGTIPKKENKNNVAVG